MGKVHRLRIGAVFLFEKSNRQSIIHEKIIN